MSFLHWDEGLCIGHPLIDEQHRQLVDLINQLDAAMLSGVGGLEIRSIFDHLVEYASRHFATEERLMDASPGWNDTEHQQEHDAFRARIIEERRALNHCRDVNLEALQNDLVDWLTHHILCVDRIMVQNWQGIETHGGAPPERAVVQQLLASMRDNRNRFRDLAHAAPVLMWTAEHGTGRHFFNQRWLSFTGRRLQEEYGEGWLDGVHPDDRAGVVASLHKAADNSSHWQATYRLRRTDGTYRWLHDIAQMRRSGQHKIGWVGAATDITEQRAAADLLAQQRDQRQAKHTDTGSHLAAQIDALGACAGLLAERLQCTDDPVAALAEARAALDGMRQLLGQMQSPTACHPDDCCTSDPAAALQQAMALLAPLLPSGIELLTELPPLPALQHSPAALRRTVLGLVGDAVQALPEGGCVTVKAWHDHTLLHLAVCASGLAVCPPSGVGDDTAHGPARFGQVCRLVEQQGGRLDIESSAQGRCVVLRLPAGALP